ncbi:MAG: hypothetical protein FWE91_10670 [Defluviitaleaceae bacterium]|nr:hypothetical protein [Defluviitaleaceae bacterium]MCL2836354.1 hypothetical protein [Defluviitaleaceae bacterium]
MKKIAVWVIIAIYVALVAGFIYFEFIDRVPKTSDIMKFMTIVLSFITAAFLWKSSINRYDGTMLLTAMLLTVVTDVFLGLFGNVFIVDRLTQYNKYITGMVCYGVTMSVYFMRYQPGRPKNALILPFFLIIPVTLYFLSRNEWFFLYGDRQRMLIIVVTYYIQALLAVIISVIKRVREGLYPKTNSILLLLSLGIFIIGDITVVLRNFDFFNIAFFSKIIWLFYTPSQALLAFSSNDYARDRERGIYYFKKPRSA